MSNRAATALDRYTQACEERDAHIEANPGVFKAHEQIVNRILDAENDLRDIVAEEGAPVSNESYRVTITPQSINTYNEDIIKAKCPEAISVMQRPPRITIGRQPKSI